MYLLHDKPLSYNRYPTSMSLIPFGLDHASHSAPRSNPLFRFRQSSATHDMLPRHALQPNMVGPDNFESAGVPSTFIMKVVDEEVEKFPHLRNGWSFRNRMLAQKLRVQYSERTHHQI